MKPQPPCAFTGCPYLAHKKRPWCIGHLKERRAKKADRDRRRAKRAARGLCRKCPTHVPPGVELCVGCAALDRTRPAPVRHAPVAPPPPPPRRIVVAAPPAAAAIAASVLALVSPEAGKPEPKLTEEEIHLMALPALYRDRCKLVKADVDAWRAKGERAFPDVLVAQIVSLADDAQAAGVRRLQDIADAIGVHGTQISKWRTQRKPGNAIENRANPPGYYAGAALHARAEATPAPPTVAAPVRVTPPSPPPQPPPTNGNGHHYTERVQAHTVTAAAGFSSEISRLRDFRKDVEILMPAAARGLMPAEVANDSIRLALAKLDAPTAKGGDS